MEIEALNVVPCIGDPIFWELIFLSLSSIEDPINTSILNSNNENNKGPHNASLSRKHYLNQVQSRGTFGGTQEFPRGTTLRKSFVQFKNLLLFFVRTV